MVACYYARMANENKKTNELVSPDDDATEELEALTWRRDAGDDHAESSADTMNFEGRDELDPAQAEAIDELRLDLQTRSETINRLQFDIEQLRARWLGLETEIKAREEMTASLVRDLDESKESLQRKTQLLKERDQTIKALKAEIRERDEIYRSLESDHASLSEQQQDSAGLIESLQQDLDHLNDELNTSDRNEQARLLLRQAEGQLASTSVEANDLRVKLARSEAYADELRNKLQNRMSEDGATETTIDQLREQLAQALADDASKADELAQREARIAELRADLDAADARHEDEIRKLRFELGEAQETVAQHALVNEQLTSDLDDTKGFKDELERMLTVSEERRQERVEELERQIVELRKQADGYEEALTSKSEAINTLLEELSRKSRQIASIGDIENAIHDLDDRMTERLGERAPGERVSRMLISNVDEQELRFPLFKDRLTIGRTRDNDIQLKAPFISRRHAVIATDGERTRVIDWGSRNGVYVNSERVTEHFLKPGDVVTIGTTEYRYEERSKRDTG